MVARHTYPMPTKENVVPGSDMAGEIVVVGEEVRLGDGELEVEDVEELTLDAPDVPLAEDACA